MHGHYFDTLLISSSSDYSSTDCSDTETENDISDGATRLTIAGKTISISGAEGNSSALIRTPGLQNIQIESGYCTIVGTSEDKNRGRRRRTKRERPPQKSHVPKLSDSRSPPSHEDLTYICNNIGRHWRKFALGLGLSHGVVDGIEVDYRSEGHYEMAWQALLKWRRQHGERARICDVIHVLDDIGLTKMASNLPVL